VRAVQFDLGELRGYRYHSGVVFAAYAPGFTGAVARGGRYDQVGEAFGRARPATGFSLDVRELAARSGELRQRRILAPRTRSPELERLVAELRRRGAIVVPQLPGHAQTRHELGCDHVIVRIDGRWQVRAADSAQHGFVDDKERRGANASRRPVSNRLRHGARGKESFHRQDRKP
jgi:ATP phosphoribosyltransferase regulatory subunit